MRLWVADGAEQIELCEQAEFSTSRPDSGALAWQRRVELHDVWQADAFVQRHLRGTGQLFELRRVLARQTLMIHQLSDDQVLQQVANELRFGSLRADVYVHRPRVWPRVDTFASPAVVAPSERPAAVAAAAPASPPPPVEAAAAPAPAPAPAVVAAVVEQPTAEVAAAQETLAAMLEQGAQDATPFCEVCEQARAAADPVPSPEAAAVQDAQAAVLEQAAEEGTPFCEVCEQAKQSRAAATNKAPAPPQPIDAVQGAQAAALEQAAVTGTPFCEICERNA
ncbi:MULTISPECIES: hypothetical protein [unclassified Pseudomonas]|uniref:hypothetical protein n=1 Tax=unclassified Pseudomonas TaxID=196821 RepID=UPI0021C639CB|nr:MULTISPECIES: hypothetical protein [unclassified Pseudomonas]MCU1732682.1 hypothetical protein [Pseudomonas sp. 20P_3.2_Bac4]MCU1744032.1 hypothetical protein [Pseudomonas sp. 20P_3.2_Bac5]